MSQAVFFRTHVLNEGVMAEYNKLKKSGYPVYLSVDNSKKVANGVLRPSEDLILVTEKDMKDMDLHFKSFHYNVEYFLLWALEKYDYDYYWLVEYDVRYNGSWKYFLDQYINVGTDLLATWIRNEDAEPWYPFWETLSQWMPCENKWAIFFPLSRFSRKSLFHLRERYRQNWHGYCEVVVPTVLKRDGFSVEDLNHPKRFYNEETWKWRPEVSVERRFKNFLFHPVNDNKNPYTIKHRIFI